MGNKEEWGERRDSNPRSPGPQPGALPLGHAHHIHTEILASAAEFGQRIIRQRSFNVNTAANQMRVDSGLMPLSDIGQGPTYADSEPLGGSMISCRSLLVSASSSSETMTSFLVW